MFLPAVRVVTNASACCHCFLFNDVSGEKITMEMIVCVEHDSLIKMHRKDHVFTCAIILMCRY